MSDILNREEFLVALDVAFRDFKITGREFITAVAGEVVIVARSKAPRLAGNDPEGHISDSIDSDPGEDGRGFFVDVGTTNRHALFMEFGTYKDKPQPFMRPALALAASATRLGGLSARLSGKRGAMFRKRAALRAKVRVGVQKGVVTAAEGRAVSKQISSRLRFRGR